MAAATPVVEVIGSIAGIVGALCMATLANPALGFGLFLVSNLAWLRFSARGDHWWLFVQQLLFLLSSLLGLWNWWLGPLVLGGGTP